MRLQFISHQHDMQHTRSSKSVTASISKAVLFCFVFTVLFVLFSFFKSFMPVRLERIAHGIAGTMAALLTTFIFLRYDKKTFTAIGLTFDKATFKNFFSGFVIGIGIMGVLTFSVIYFSGFTIETNASSGVPNFLLWTLPLIPLAFMEEVAFRGYPLAVMKERTGIRNSIIVTSILFALYHIANGWSVQNAFLGAGAWGLLYGTAAVYANGISMPTGLHFAANFTTSAFGITGDSFNIWVLRNAHGGSLENYESSQMETLIPQISVLVLGMVAMEWVSRRK